MDILERRSRIRNILGIEPISHGQIYTCQIAIPEEEQENLSSDRLQIIEDSLNQYKSNLIPLIVRRTEAYSEDEEYEVIYGADWCVVAKELGVEKLWVWVFDLTNEQAIASKEEMQQLMNIYPENISLNTNQKPLDFKNLEQQINKLSLQVEFIKNNLEKMNSLIPKIEEIDVFIKKLEIPTIQRINIDSSVIEELREAMKIISADNLNPNNSSNKTKSSLSELKNEKLREIAKNRGIKVTAKMNKSQLIDALEKGDNN
jgi:ParB-like chromosome segregation protein Spo0J